MDGGWGVSEKARMKCQKSKTAHKNAIEKVKSMQKKQVDVIVRWK